MGKILIVDDDKFIHDWITNGVAPFGHTSASAGSLEEGLKKAQSEPFDIVFVDAQLLDSNGLNIIPKIRATPSFPEIIVITRLGDPDEAELAIQNGAWDYLVKPASFESIKLSILRALEYRADKRQAKTTAVLKRSGIIGDSPKMASCLELLTQAAGSNANVLITGETGTGKELFAKAIHSNSSRAKRNFVIVDCTALPETLVESVLFGHERGAFTGADRSEEGLIKQADGGTLFLDEIGELPFLVQKRFLRVIQEHRFRPVGGRQEVHSEFRLVAATNQNLESMVRQGRFREDLLFRLRTLVIELPPLREWLEDLKKLTIFYLKDLCERFGLEPKEVSPEFWDVITLYRWPGNVRELIQALEKALISAEDEPVLFIKHLPTYIRIQVARSSFLKNPAIPGRPKYAAGGPQAPPKLKDIRRAAISEAEQQYLRDLISFTGGDNNKACRISGLSRSRFYTLLKKYRTADGNGPA
jgi:two-component system NtrC family response regulator